MERDNASPDPVDRGRHRLAALRLANDVRRDRAALKQKIAEGGLSAAEVLLDPSPAAAGCPLVDLLMSQRKWGRVKVSKFLARNQIGASKRISDLTDHQRRLLAAQLRDRASTSTALPSAPDVRKPQRSRATATDSCPAVDETLHGGGGNGEHAPG